MKQMGVKTIWWKSSWWEEEERKRTLPKSNCNLLENLSPKLGVWRRLILFIYSMLLAQCLQDWIPHYRYQNLTWLKMLIAVTRVFCLSLSIWDSVLLLILLFNMHYLRNQTKEFSSRKISSKQPKKLASDRHVYLKYPSLKLRAFTMATKH